jgi:tRNA(Ile)-lysidine synthase
MLERVIAYIEQHQLLPEQGEIVVGVSGGADSLCLLHLLRQICGPGKRFAEVTLQAAHLDHMLRGEESARDAAQVASMMEEWEVPCTLGKVDVTALARAEKRSLEDAARLARYRFLREVARGGRIAVAHHADDQVETLLLHWLRGSGLSGMVGMQPRQQDIIRPLLAVSRAETRAYCQENGITPLEDHSNIDPRFVRNRIRHELLPLLRQLNPGIQRTLLRNAEIARVDLEWLEEQIDHCWGKVVISEAERALRLDVRALLALHLSLQRHLLRRVTARLYEGQSPLEPRHLLLIESLLSEHTEGQERELHLPRQLRVYCQGNALIFERLAKNREAAARCSLLPPANDGVLLPLPGSVRVPGTPWRAKAELLDEKLAVRVSAALRQNDWHEVWRLLEPPTRHSVYIDAEATGEHILVRTRRPGDRIQPLGMPAEKKVQDIFVDNHIPRAERATTPLFFSDQHCLWIAGACLDHRVRLTSKTRRIARLSVQPV